MSSLQTLRQFVNDRLFAAAEEIFGVFQQTVSELENEVNRQRELLDVLLKEPVARQQTKVVQEPRVTEHEDYLQQEYRPSLGPEEPEAPHHEGEKQENVFLVHVKREEEDPREEQPSTSSLTQHIKQEFYQDGSEPDTLLLLDQTGSLPSEYDTDDSEHWAETCDARPGANSVANLTLPDCEKNVDPENTLLICSRCGSQIFSRRGMTEHLKSCCKSLTCLVCGKSFAKQQNLKIHMRVHTGEKPFSCSHCGKSFTQNWYLKAHMRIHTGEKPFKCSHCDKEFTHKWCLKEHIKTHTGEKPFNCPQCGKCFAQKGHLKVHMRNHIGENLQAQL